MEIMTLKEILKEIKKEFNEHNDDGCVIIDNMPSRFGFSYEDGWLEASATLFKDVVKQLEHTKGVFQVIPTEFPYGGCFSSKRIITCLRLIRKPCKEFLQLNNYLQKYTSVNSLKWNDVKRQNVSGKRDNYEVNEEKLLMHDSRVCKDILSWLRKSKASTYNVRIYTKRNQDKSSGYREEREWEGYYDDYLVVELYTKKCNKLKSRATFHIY